MSAPRKPRVAPYWPESKSGDSRSERALKAGNLPPTLEPTAIPRRERLPRDIRFHRIQPANGQEGSSARPPIGLAAPSSTQAKGSAGSAFNAAASVRESGNAVASSSGWTAGSSTSSVAAQGSDRSGVPAASKQAPVRPPQPAASAAGAREPLFYSGPSTQTPGPPARPPSVLPPRPPFVASTSVASGSTSSSSHTPAARGPVHRPHHPPRNLDMSHSSGPAPPTPRPTYPGSAPSSSVSTARLAPARLPPRPNGVAGGPPPMRPFIAAGPKAAVPFPYPQVRRESQGSGSSSPATGNPGPHVARPPQNPPLPTRSAAVGSSVPLSTGPGRPAVHDAVPLAEHEALLSRPSSRTGERPNGQPRPEKEQQPATTNEVTDHGTDGGKGKGREVASALPSMTAAASTSHPPAATSLSASTASASEDPPSARPPTHSSTGDERAPATTAASIRSPTRSRIESPVLPVAPASQPTTPAPLTSLPNSDLKPSQAAAAIVDDGSSDDDDDVEAALLEAQRKLAELQEKKRLKALRKSLGGSDQRSDVSQSPAPPPASVVPSASAPLSTSTSLNTAAVLMPATATKTSLPTTPSASASEAVDPTLVPAQDLVPPPPREASSADAEPLPNVVDGGPQPFGTPSQVVFSDLPPETSELALRRFISGTLVSVKLVDFQDAFALVTFSNPHDASEVVRMLSDEEFTPGCQISIDLASNLELVNEPIEASLADVSGSVTEPEQLPPQSAHVSPAKPPVPPPQVEVKRPPPSPHDSLFSSQRHSPPTQTGLKVPRRQSSATSVDEALDEPTWAAKKRRRVESSPQQPAVRVKEELKAVVDLTFSSDDERRSSTSSTAVKDKRPTQPKEATVAKRVKYGPPELKLLNPKKLTAPRQPNNKTRWIAVGEDFYACAYHKGIVEFFDKKSLESRPTVRFEMAEGESVEGITFAGNRLIVGRQRRTADEMRPQVSWVSAPSLRKNKDSRVQSGTIDDQAHSGMGVSCLAPLPSTALTAETSLSTSVYATGGFDHAVKLWKFDDESRRKLWALHSTDHTSRVDALIWDDQKKWLYSAGADGRILGFDLTKARMSDWVLARSQTGVFQLHLSTAHPALLLAETNRVNQQLSLYDTRLSPTRPPLMFGDGESGSGVGAEGGSKGRSRYVRGSWQENLFASADQTGNLRVWDVRYLKSCYTYEIQPKATPNRQIVLDGDRLLDLTGEGLFSRKWRLL